MGSGDLNLKKSWHPSKYQNKKKVWEAQQVQEREKEQLAQLKKEKEAEKELEELYRLQSNAGLVPKKENKVDWMYSGESVKTNSKLSEDFLLGRKKDTKNISKENSYAKRSIAGRLEASKKIERPRNSTKDNANRMRDDPMTIISKHEKEYNRKFKK